MSVDRMSRRGRGCLRGRGLPGAATGRTDPPAGRGFTLIELLVVIAIIALLLSLLTPSLQQAKALGVRAQCYGTQRALLTALNQYLTDEDDTFPVRAPFWITSPDDPGPDDAWFTDPDRFSDEWEGIGEYLGKEGSELHCSAAEEHEAKYSWGVPADLPTFVPNRTIIPYNMAAGMPKASRCAQKRGRIGNLQRTFVFADGNWRGVFQAFSLSYEERFERFFWTPHLDGTNVGYLDNHVAWVNSTENIHPNDWPSHYNPCLNWCDMTDWAIMWK